MKKIIIPFLLLAHMGFAQNNEVEVKSTVKEVTVYLSGVQEIRQAKVSIPAGNSVLRFTGLPNTLQTGSIQVRGVNDFTILSLNYRVNHLQGENADPEIIQLRDSIEKVQHKLEIMSAEKSALAEERSMIQTNRRIAGDNGLVIDDLHEISDFTSERIKNIDLRLFQIRREEDKLSKTNQALQQEINQISNGRKTANGEVLVNISAPKAAMGLVQLSYLTFTGGWRPQYDVRAKEVGGPVALAYKAQLFQSTGTDWSNVKLTLSTATPNMNNSKPVVPVWYLDFATPVNQNSYLRQDNYMGAGAYSNTTLTTGATYSWSQPASIAANAINTEFKIQSPYSIPSNGIEYVVEIGTFEFPASYVYSAIPKLAREAFLMARITGWNDYSLLAAETNIYFQGTYIGKSFLNTSTTKDTLELSMGSDESVVVERKNVTELSSKSQSGSTRKKQEDWEISVRNTKPIAIDIEVMDQVPVSTQKEIQVEILELSGATMDKVTGKCTWKLHLEPGETKKIKLSYLVKYPKDFIIDNL